MTRPRGDLDPEALDELAELGYRVTTFEEALDAARQAHGLTAQAAEFYVTGERDLGEVRPRG